MYRIASIVLIALALVACGGDGDDSNDTDSDAATSSGGAPTATVASGSKSTPASTTAVATTASGTSSAAESTATVAGSTDEPAATPTEAASGPDSIEGAPTNASADFPDVQVPLEAGSSGEVGSMDPDPFAATDSLDENSRVRVTINEVLDPAEIEGSIIVPEPGFRWFAIDITMEATGSAIANTGVWWLTTTDGTEYTNAIALGTPPDITYGSIEPGASVEGVVVFEIPEGATVAWILMSPTIFVGGNLVFVS